jgi:CRP/FNR family transcriptional regulator, anaerobic regulatory protein
MTFVPSAPPAPIVERLLAFPFAREVRDLDRLLAAASPVERPAGASVQASGSPVASILLVEAGEIRVFRRSGAREITLYRVPPGGACVLAAAALLSGDPYPADAVVAADLRAIALDAAALRAVHSDEPAVQRYLLALLSDRFADLMVLLHEVTFRRLDERLVAFLLDACERSPGLYFPLEQSHDEIGAHLGTAREVVSRLLSDLEAAGLVALGRRQVRIVDPDGLRRRIKPAGA